MTKTQDSLNTRRRFSLSGKTYDYFSLAQAGETIGSVERLPYSLKILLENLLRFEDGGYTVGVDDIKAFGAWLENPVSGSEIAFRPSRVLMQDFTGVPGVVDLATMRDSLAKSGGDPEKINPLVPVDLVIDHSVTVDFFGGPEAMTKNTTLEFERNKERYEFLKWGQKAFRNFRVVPPGTGICHQVNLEYLASVVFHQDGDNPLLYPDSCVGTDSHTTMVNGLGVLGWGVGGIEAEAVMLGQPVSMLIPEVVGYRLTGRLKEGVTATDLVLTITEALRKLGVVGKFVEFFGEGLEELSLPNRATISNMSPEFGATCAIFPIDRETTRYLEFTQRNAKLVEAYARENMLWHDANTPDPVYSTTLELDLETVEPSLAGPKRPQDRIGLNDAKTSFHDLVGLSVKAVPDAYRVPNKDYDLKDGDVVIAAITSCTNTSNPDVLIAAGLLAKKAVERGLSVKPWVKTSLAPGSQVVAQYLEESHLQDSLNSLGFYIAGFGCTTCIGNSGPLDPDIVDTIEKHDLTVSAVLSGNRNFEGRISPQVKANYLASPPLVVAYALAGTMRLDLTRDPLGLDRDGNEVYLKDIWPTNQEISRVVLSAVRTEMYRDRYANVFDGTEQWQKMPTAEGALYDWDDGSTYVRLPPFFEGGVTEKTEPLSLNHARALAVLGDSITTDHISPAGAIKEDSPAGRYLKDQGIEKKDFNSYGARRGNHEVMMRGTFANIRIRNKMVPGVEGGFTKHYPSENVMSIFDAAQGYLQDNTPLLVFGGKEYGTGSSRDWAAKGTKLLGVRAVIAESFERIHRTNLVCMGVLPLQFNDGDSLDALKLSGAETFALDCADNELKTGQTYRLTVTYPDGKMKEVALKSRIDTANELAYYAHDGILSYVLKLLG